MRGRIRLKGVKRQLRHFACGYQRTVCDYILGKTLRGMELGNAEKLLGFGTKGNHCRLRDPKTEKCINQSDTEIAANAKDLLRVRNFLKHFVCLRLSPFLQMKQLRLQEVK